VAAVPAVVVDVMWLSHLSFSGPAWDWGAQLLWLGVWVALCLYALRLWAPTLDGPQRSLWCAALVVALFPAIPLFESLTAWVVNYLLYVPGLADVRFVGPFRGELDTTPYMLAIATTDEPLSALSRTVLGWTDERHPFALVTCAPLVGDTVWALIALGLHRLLRRQRDLALAYLVSALLAATAPLFTLGYYYLVGGSGLNAWSGLFPVLLGSIEAGGQVPHWIRAIGVVLFYGTPALVLVQARRFAAREQKSAFGLPRDAGGSLAADLWPPVACVLLLLVLWWRSLAGSPIWPWPLQAAWLTACLAALIWTYGAWTGLRFTVAQWLALLGVSLPLAVCGLVVQIVAQWLVARAWSADFRIEFLGLVFGQLRALPPGSPVPPLALGAAVAGNLVWLAVLLAFARRCTRRGRLRAALALRIGAFQAAIAPNFTCALMILSIVTRDRAAAGVPRYDAWHLWSYLTRSSLGASIGGQEVPMWLSVLGVTVMLGLPLYAFTRIVMPERQRARAAAGLSDAGCLPAAARPRRFV